MNYTSVKAKTELQKCSKEGQRTGGGGPTWISGLFRQALGAPGEDLCPNQSVSCQATRHQRHVQAVPSPGEGRIRRGESTKRCWSGSHLTTRVSAAGVRVSGESYREDVRLQEAGEEEDKEEERGIYGSQRKSDLGKGQQQIRCEYLQAFWGGSSCVPRPTASFCSW